MSVADILAVLRIVDPRRKPLERLGTFLCRRKVAAFEHDLAAARADAEERADKIRELERELKAKEERLAALERAADFRRRFARVPVGGGGVFVCRERRGDADGAPARLACPVCYERNQLGLVFPELWVRKVGGVRKKSVHLRCLAEGCRFHVIVTPEAFRKAFEFAD